MYNFEDDNPIKNEFGDLSSNYYRDLLNNSEQRDLAYDQATSNVEDVEVIEVDDQSSPDPYDSMINGQPSKVDDPFLEEERSAKGQQSDSMKLLTKGTTGFADQVDKMLDIKRVQDAQSVDVVKTFRDLFNDLNTTYGLDIQFDFNSFTRTLQYMITPRNMKAVEVYISEAYSRTRATLYLLYLNSIAQLSTQVLDPRFLTSNSMSYTDRLLLLRELFTYLKSLDEIYEKVKVKDGDIRLRKLSEESEEGDTLQNENVQAFLDTLMQNVKQGDNKNSDDNK